MLDLDFLLKSAQNCKKCTFFRQFNPIPHGGHKVLAQLLISCPHGNFWYFS